MLESVVPQEKKGERYAISFDRFRDACWVFRIPQRHAEEVLEWMVFIAHSLNTPDDESVTPEEEVP